MIRMIACFVDRTLLGFHPEGMCHEYGPRKRRTDQLVTLLAIHIPVLPCDCERVVEGEPRREIEIDAVFGTIYAILAFIPIESHPYIHIGKHDSGQRLRPGYAR
jgi:hypothetical protein